MAPTIELQDLAKDLSAQPDRLLVRLALGSRERCAPDILAGCARLQDCGLTAVPVALSEVGRTLRQLDLQTDPAVFDILQAMLS